MGGPKLYSILFSYNEIKNSKNNIVLLGEVGSGKTTLMNKLTGSDFKTGKNCTSVTSEVQIASSRDYRNIIFDFPGFKVRKDIVPIFEVQYRTLKNITIKAICFVVERRDRYESIVDDLISLKEIFEDYEDNIIIIITKTENYDDNIKNKVRDYIANETKFNKIIFTNENTSGRDLLNTINNLKEGMNNLEGINPKSNEFIKHFKLNTENNMKRARREYTQEFNDALEIFQNEFNKPTTDKSLKRALYFSFRDFKNNLIEKYYEVAKREQVISNSVIEHVLAFSNHIYHKFEEFRTTTEREIEVNLSNYSGHLNKFKKCPHCGTIWFKVAGCEGKTKCGNRDKIRDIFCGIFKDYVVKYENKNLEIQKLDFNQQEKLIGSEFIGLTNEEIQQNQTLENEGKTLINPVGCGNWITWREMEDVTEIINEKLQSISNRDYDIKFKEIKKKEEEQSFSNEISYLNTLK